MYFIGPEGKGAGFPATAQRSRDRWSEAGLRPTSCTGEAGDSTEDEDTRRRQEQVPRAPRDPAEGRPSSRGIPVRRLLIASKWTAARSAPQGGSAPGRRASQRFSGTIWPAASKGRWRPSP